MNTAHIPGKILGWFLGEPSIPGVGRESLFSPLVCSIFRGGGLGTDFLLGLPPSTPGWWRLWGKKVIRDLGKGDRVP